MKIIGTPIHALMSVQFESEPPLTKAQILFGLLFFFRVQIHSITLSTSVLISLL